MGKLFHIETPMGQIQIPYSEDAVLNFARKVLKVSEGEPNLLEEATLDYLGITDIESSESDWVFWEEDKVPIYIYDMMGWIDSEFDIVQKLGFSMNKRKPTGIQFHQFDYPHGKEKMPIRVSLFIKRKSDGVPFIMDFTPLDGLHIEVQIIHLPEVKIEDFHKSYEDYAATKGILKNNTNDPDESEKYFCRALELNVDNVLAIKSLIEISYKTENFNRAKNYLKLFLEIHPANINMLFAMAGIQFKRGEIEDSLQTLDEVLLLDPKHQYALDFQKSVRTVSV